MYKEHLVNNVTSSLSDLANFLREADEGKVLIKLANNYNLVRYFKQYFC